MGVTSLTKKKKKINAEIIVYAKSKLERNLRNYLKGYKQKIIIKV